MIPVRKLVLYGAMLATLVAAVWVSGEGEPETRQRRGDPARTGLASGADVPLPDLSLPQRTPVPGQGEIRDPFKLARLDSASIVAKPVAAEAPALPFVFVGRYADGRDQQVFLGAGEALYAVRRGDVIDGKYRIDSIENEIRITYLPLRQTQVLQIGDKQ